MSIPLESIPITNDQIIEYQAIHDHPMQKDQDDEMVGAVLISHLRQHCENCATYITPQWRKGWFSDILNHSVLLCNACGLKFNKGQFCSYCKFVYGKEQRMGEIWLACDQCTRWVHRKCEEEHGGNLNDRTFKCVDCRSGIVPNYFSRNYANQSNLRHSERFVDDSTRAMQGIDGL